MNKVLYILSYDLIKDKDYQKLYNELSNFKAKRVLESVWCFKYEPDKSSYLRDHFTQFIDKDDRLLVVRAYGWAGRKLLFSPNDL